MSHSTLQLVVLIAVSVTAGASALTGGVPSSLPDASAVAPPCNNYYSNVKDPPNIGVAITDANGNISDVIYVDFKSYVKDGAA